jgi:hypothetical protein
VEVRLDEAGHHDAVRAVDDLEVARLGRVGAADVNDRAIDARDVSREHAVVRVDRQDRPVPKN